MVQPDVSDIFPGLDTSADCSNSELYDKGVQSRTFSQFSFLTRTSDIVQYPVLHFYTVSATFPIVPLKTDAGKLFPRTRALHEHKAEFCGLIELDILKAFNEPTTASFIIISQ